VTAHRNSDSRDEAPDGVVPTNTIGVLISEPPARLFGDPVFSTLLDAINSALAEHSLLMVMFAPQSARELESAQAHLLGGHVDGAILVGLRGGNQMLNRLIERGIPVVLCGLPSAGVAVSCVDGDNRQGAALAVEHLISLGRRTIATISGDLDMAGAVDRRMGYRDALVTAGVTLVPTLEEVADYLPDRAQMAMERLLLNHPRVDAVFAASDLMAAAAVRVLRQAGKRIPEDVAVVGFDDSPTARATDPPLTSVHQPLDEIGREAVNILVREMNGSKEVPREVIFATTLVVRESTVGAAPVGRASRRR